MRKQIMTALLTLSLVGTLSSCSLVGFWLSGCGGEKADLVVVNESSAVIDGISVTEGSQTQSVSSEDGSGLLECGESYGLELAGTGECVVVLFDCWQRELARSYVEFQGERLFLTLKDWGTMTCTTENTMK